MKLIRNKSLQLVMMVILLLAATVLATSCTHQESVPGLDAGIESSCVSCHSDQAQLMALATTAEPLEAAESEGEG